MTDWLVSFMTHPVTLLTAGGGAGTNARYWLGRAVSRAQVARFPGVEFPWATFVINVSGSVVLGGVAALCLGYPTPDPDPGPVRRGWYLLLATGFCGGYTTFSTFSLETFQLLQDDRPWSALAYSIGSVAAGVGGVWLAARVLRG